MLHFVNQGKVNVRIQLENIDPIFDNAFDKLTIQFLKKS